MVYTGCVFIQIQAVWKLLQSGVYHIIWLKYIVFICRKVREYAGPISGRPVYKVMSRDVEDHKRIQVAIYVFTTV